jgi:hypothetical protein
MVVTLGWWQALNGRSGDNGRVASHVEPRSPGGVIPAKAGIQVAVPLYHIVFPLSRE